MCLSHECIQSETKGLQMYGHPWNLDPPKGFVGFREDLPCRLYRRRLPHWRQPGASYFCTYRLVDSLPQWRLDELKRLREEWTRKHLNSENAKSLQDLDELIYQRIEYWLDQGMGSCVLGKDQASLSIHRSMQHFHSTRYELGASVVMPNHVHCIVRPFESPSYELEDILGGWKSFWLTKSIKHLSAMVRFGWRRLTIVLFVTRSIFGAVFNTSDQIQRGRV